MYDQQENNAYNGQCESTCYHPLLLFNREGDCLAAKLRRADVYSADGSEDMLLAEIERHRLAAGCTLDGGLGSRMEIPAGFSADSQIAGGCSCSDGGERACQ